MSWHAKADIEVLRQRAAAFVRLRNFFAKRNVLEVDTPLLGAKTVTDVNLHSLSTCISFNSKSQQCFLQTSPEFYMKRLLASGSGCIYQLSNSYRDQEQGNLHSPEFSMLEWYRVGFDHHSLMLEVSDFLHEVFSFPVAQKISYQSVFLDHLSIDPFAISFPSLQKFAKSKSELSSCILDELDFDSILQILFVTFIEPILGLASPVIVYDFPASQAALAKINPENPSSALRFEVFYKGIELANGYNELQNPVEQLSRFKKDQEIRFANKLPLIEIDYNVISALKSGLPDCSGVALGFDRSLMIALGKKSISEIRPFEIF